ncbi:MAG: GTPase Obg [Eubacteriales bacterium SKADARSKE-1]|nr:GTPase Obg [Eubacteriales bacterium SKADARSKE-1]
MFVDIAKIKIKAGNGGNGAVSFHREKYVAAGGPDGGDGGRGGNIMFKADDNLSTLADFRYKRKYIAQNGQNGKAARSSGKSAPDLVIKVPRGTLIKDIETGQIIADISTDEENIVAHGGKGGFGNMHFATPTRQAPRFAKPGMDGEELEVQLELKLLADVALIGYPNVGKSTLISVVSEAKPVISNYHFTTITPVLGVVRRADGRSFVMADIPGLIEGAEQGVGLGHQFLRHIERCRLLVHVVDVSGSEGRDPISDFKIINNELKKFNPELANRPMLVVGNKCDLASEDQIENFRKYINDLGFKFFPIMAAINYGTEPLLNAIEESLSKLPPIKIYEAEKPSISTLENDSDQSFKIIKENGIYTVEGKWLIRLINSINFDDYESLQYFQKILISSGINQALLDSGIKNGDTVKIHGFEFDFIE